MPTNLPKARIVCGGEHGSFTGGDEASSSMKGCSLCMYLRCVRATRASAHDICSNLPARRTKRRGFASRSARMYLSRSNASLHTIRSGFGWAHGDGVRACAHLVGTVVVCQRRPEKVYTRLDVSTPSRAVEMSSYRSP